MGTVSKKKKSSKRSAAPKAAPLCNPMDTAAGVRAFAMNAGEMSMFVMQEVTRIMQAQRFSQTKAIDVGIDRLRTDGFVSTTEAKDLKLIAKHIFRATRKKPDIIAIAAHVRELYKNMAMSPHSSPVALAIASAANASLMDQQYMASLPKGAIAKVVVTPGKAGVGALIGGVLGGVIGGIAGGGLGAGVGAAIGAAAGGAIGFCNDKGV